MDRFVGYKAIVARWRAGAVAAILLGGLSGAVGIFGASRRPPAQPAGTDPPFVDVAPGAGIRFTLGYPDGLLDVVQTSGNGCGFLDFDRDGHLDLLLLGENRCALFRNAGDGRFTEVSGRVGLPQRGRWIGCASADYDNDGYPDLFLNGYDCYALLHNEGGRSFRDVTAIVDPPRPARMPSFGTSAAWADIDRDGWLDLYVARYVEFGPGVRAFCDSEAGTRHTCGPDHYEPQFGTLYRNLRGRRFEDVTRRMGADRVHGKAFGLVFADFDADGWTDLYIANDEVPGDLLRNLGGKRFENIGISAGVAFDADGRVHGGMGADAGDYDGDGRMDLVVATFVNEPYCLYRNDGGRVFTECGSLAGIAVPTTPMSGWGTKLFDYDNDGRLDLLFVNGHATDSDHTPDARPDLAQPMQLFRNEGRFLPVSLGPLDAPIVGRGAAFGDYDNDGFTDVLVSDLEGPARLLRNRLAERRPRAHWLGLSLVGTASNRDGLGARVIVRSGRRRQVAEVRTCGSVYAANDPRLRFGLGSATRADEVIVRWPSGICDRLTDLGADRYWTVVEGRSGSATAAGAPPAKRRLPRWRRVHGG